MYLVAGSGARAATYRVTQILDAVTVDGHFERPDGFDLVDYWSSYLEDFEARRYTGTATIRLSPRARQRLTDNVPRAVAQAVDSNATVVGDEGWVEAVIPIESVQHACGELLRLGTDVKVVAPVELRQLLASTVYALAHTYRFR